MVVLSGCATRPEWPAQPAHTPIPEHYSATRLDQRQLLDHVPFHGQELFQCGPASLAMMLNSQGLTTDPNELKNKVYLPDREGSLRVELVATARSYGLVVYPLQPSLSHLLSEVAAGHPVLVMQNLRLSWWPQWHFAVVVGFDPDPRRVILNTDTREQHEETLEVFMATWTRAGNWAAVMLPPDQLPATAEPLPYLMAVNDLEVTGHTEAASQAYAMAEVTWPEQPAPIMGQGNIAYQQADWSSAVQHYLRLTQKFPELGAGWNNLAHALGQTGCHAQAEEALEHARSLNPDRFSEPLESDSSGAASACPVMAQ